MAGLGGQGLLPSLTRWFVDGRHIGWPVNPGPLVARMPPGSTGYVLRLAVVAALVGLGYRRLRDRRLHPSVAAALCLLTVTLALEPSWHHYFTFLPFAQAVALGRARLSPAAGWLALGSWAVSALPLLLLHDLPGIYFQYSAWGGTTVAALLAWAALWSLGDSARTKGEVGGAAAGPWSYGGTPATSPRQDASG